jgi:hypothetical protein
MANTFFIYLSPPFKGFPNHLLSGVHYFDGEKYAFFLPCQDKFIIIYDEKS